MAKHKPKQDKRATGPTRRKTSAPIRETKPHGDKLQRALDAISDALDDPQQPPKRLH